MNTFRTSLRIPPSEQKITHASNLFAIGSCFANNIGTRLEAAKFHTCVNPFGIIFNPLSIFELLTYTIENQIPGADTFLTHKDLSMNYKLHSDFTAMSHDELLLMIEGAIHTSHDLLKKSNWLLLTFGTAMVYHLNDSNKLVANCHKQPSHLFTKSMTEPADILSAFSDLIEEIKRFNPDLQIILSVSPVRHLKDTLQKNAVSKSILRYSCEKMQEAHDNVQYFPAYELQLDDLRDYRFYESDMLHPSTVAKNYIWHSFTETYLTEEAQNLHKKWMKVKKSLDHVPFQKQSQAYKDFRDNALSQLLEISSELDVQKEINQLQNG